MPARETVWRNLKTMHVVFAVSSVLLLAATVWMMADDYASEWRGYQQTFDKIEELKYRAAEKQLTSGSYEAELEETQQQIERARADLESRQQKVGALRESVAERKLQHEEAEARLRSQRARLTKARADYDLAVRDERDEQTLSRLYNRFSTQQAAVDRLELDVQDLQRALEEKQGDLNRQTAELTAAEDAKKNLEAQVKQTETALSRVAPDNWFSAAKRSMLDWYILDGFSQVHKVRMDWLPDLKIKLGMASTARFDRCRTCHLGIDRVEAGNVPTFPWGKTEADDPADWVASGKYPQPYSTHPRPDLYLTASSPHPVEEFGCTICHEGQGSATDFNNAQHGPNDPHQEELWEEEYHHHYNHHWEYPMLPQRFREASCLKCHHNVVELGVNPKYGASAPKLFRGYQLIQTYGCFGCHEIQGFASGEAIGPDLRLEPNYNPAALQLLYLLASPGQTPPAENGHGGGLAEIRRLAEEVAENPVDSPEARHRLQTLLDGDAGSPSPRFSADVHALAALFADADQPGRYRKVGPALRYIASKTTPAWVEYWTAEPKRFRPTTRMPQFFGQANQEDPHAAALMPVELTAIAEYLFDKSQPFDEQLLHPPEGYQPDAERGKLAFSRRGCLACHSHTAFPEITADFGPELSRVAEKVKRDAENPAFSSWLYTWLRDPKRYHPRTKMPNLFLEPITSVTSGTDVGGNATEVETTIDPAADIAAFLLAVEPDSESPALRRYEPRPYLGVEVEVVGSGKPGVRVTRVMPYSPASRARVPGEAGRPSPVRFGDVVLKYDAKTVNDPNRLAELVAATSLETEVTLELSRGGQPVTVTVVVDEPLDDLVRLYLTKTIGIEPTKQVIGTRKYPGDPRKIKGDEVELVASEIPGISENPRNLKPDHQPDDDQWRQMKLNYVGRRTISRYGCYGCHDIPGFEAARSIGTTLQDWGRKDTTKLAPEHIAEYLAEHGEPDGSSTHERVIQALKKVRAGGVEAGEFASPEEEERELRVAALYDNLLHHRRAGFVWQKLRSPRSYDYRKIETKGYDERLRMPRFTFGQTKHENGEAIEAIATFVLGLVAEPPMERYIYNPQGPQRARIEGEFLLERYNCLGCHMVELPQVAYALDASDTEHPYRNLVGWTADEIAEWFVDNRAALRAALLAGEMSAADYPADVQLMQRLGAPLEEIIQLTNDPRVTATDKAGLARLRKNVRTWLGEHPHYMLIRDLDPRQGEFPEGIARLLELKPPVSGETGRTRDDGQPVIRFHGLLNQHLEEPFPEDEIFQYQLWTTLDVGGKILLPARTFPFNALQIEREMFTPPRGGTFAMWLVEQLNADRSSKAFGDRAWGWTMAPPPLYLEGIKVQTPWLYKFLKNPQRIRHETVLRMPRFNLDDAEARSLANYFAAVDDSAFPYQAIPQREPSYWERKNAALAPLIPDDSDYLAESWKLLNANICIGCHSVAGKPFKAGPDPSKVTHGPDLNYVHERLQPGWLALWTTKPQWITPYTKMIVPKAIEPLLGGNAPDQSEALRDALLNYPMLYERDGAIFYDPRTQTVKPASAAVAAPTE